VKRAALISLIVGAALAIVPAAFAVEMSDGGGVSGVSQTVTMAPTSYQDALRTYGSMSPAHQLGGGSEAVTPLSQIDPAIRAVLVRNSATHSVPLTGKALADFYDTGAVVTSQPSVPLTGKALADFYDTGAVVTSQPFAPVTGNVTDVRGDGSFVGQTDTLSATGTTQATSDGSTSIDWSALIPAILLSILLLATASAVVTRRRHQLSV